MSVTSCVLFSDSFIINMMTSLSDQPVKLVVLRTE